MAVSSFGHRTMVVRDTFGATTLAANGYTAAGAAGAAAISNNGVLFTINAAEYGQLHKGDTGPLIADWQFIEIAATINLGATSVTELYFGVASATNADPDAIAASAWFKLTSTAGVPVLKIESDDGTNDLSKSISGITVPTGSPVKFRIDFSTGVQTKSPPARSLGHASSLQFSVTDARGYRTPVRAADAHMDMSNYAGFLQPWVHVEHTTDNEDTTVLVHEICYGFRTY